MNKYYKIKIDEEALADIHSAKDWYDEQLKGLGKKFRTKLKKDINSLKTNPFVCAVRYNNARCLVMKKFPFMVHYKIDTDNLLIEIFAVLHTSRNPQIWEERKK